MYSLSHISNRWSIDTPVFQILYLRTQYLFDQAIRWHQHFSSVYLRFIPFSRGSTCDLPANTNLSSLKRIEKKEIQTLCNTPHHSFVVIQVRNLTNHVQNLKGRYILSKVNDIHVIPRNFSSGILNLPLSSNTAVFATTCPPTYTYPFV